MAKKNNALKWHSQYPYSFEEYGSKQKYYQFLSKSLNRPFATVKGSFIKSGAWKEIESSPIKDVTLGKDEDKFNTLHWKDGIKHVKELQQFKSKHNNYDQDIRLSINSDKPIYVMLWGDTQIGDFGSNMDLFYEATQILLNDPNMYVMLLGDLAQMAVVMRSVKEMLSGAALNPKEQYYFIESWLKDIKHKVICSTWCNHVSVREEKVLGWSPFSDMMAKHTNHFGGIGHIDLKVNDIEYKIAASHHFKGRSYINKAHAPIRYIREYAHDREIAVQGDYHDSGVLSQNYGGRDIAGAVCGSIQTNSGYAKRYFTLKTYPYIPVLCLGHEYKIFDIAKNLNSYLTFRNDKNMTSRL